MRAFPVITVAMYLLVFGVCTWVGYLWGVTTEWQRVKDYLDLHLDKDADWIRSGIGCDEHHERHRGTRRG